MIVQNLKCPALSVKHTLVYLTCGGKAGACIVSFKDQERGKDTVSCLLESIGNRLCLWSSRQLTWSWPHMGPNEISALMPT